MIVVKKDKKGFYHADQEGRPLYQKRYCHVRPFKHGLARVISENSDQFHIDLSGKRAYPFNFQYAGDFHLTARGQLLAPATHRGVRIFICPKGQMVKTR